MQEQEYNVGDNDMNVRFPQEMIKILDKSVNGKNIDEKVRL